MPSDKQNPFATTEPTPAAWPSTGGSAPVDVEVGAILGRVGEHVLAFVSISLIVAGLLFGLRVAMAGLSFGLTMGGVFLVIAFDVPEEATRGLDFLLSLSEVFLTSLILLGAYRAFLTGARGGMPSPGQLFGEGSALVSYVVVTLMLVLAGAVVSAPAIGAGVATYYGEINMEVMLVIVVINLALLMVLGSIVSTFTQFLGLVLVDQGLGPIEGLKECWRVTEGHRLLAYALWFALSTLTVMLSVVTCGFGNAISEVLGSWVRTVTYRSLIQANGRSPHAVEGPL